MRVLYCPQYHHLEKIEYTFEGDIITATINGESDVFDFTNLPDGELDDIETTLSLNPVVHAEKKDSVLYIKLLMYIGDDATYAERFPYWGEAI